MNKNLKIEILKLLGEKSNVIFQKNLKNISDFLEQKYDYCYENYDYRIKTEDILFDGNVNEFAIVDPEQLDKYYLNDLINYNIPLSDTTRCQNCKDYEVNIKCEDNNYYFSICKHCGTETPCIILNFKNDLLNVFNPKHIKLS